MREFFRKAVKWVPVSLLLLQTGCGVKTETTQTEGASAGQFEIVPAVFAVKEQKRGNDTEASIGSLKFANIPYGWKLEQSDENGEMQYVLTDIHSLCEGDEMESHQEGYEHEIVITPYTIRQMPESSLELAAEMKKYFDVPLFYGITGNGKIEAIEGCWMFGEDHKTQESIYFLFSTNENGETELFHVRENSVYSVGNEVEAFWKFLYEGIVQTDGGRHIANWRTPGDEPMEYYFRFNGNAKEPLFVVAKREGQKTGRQLSVYREGCYEAPLAQLQAEKLDSDMIGIADINRDGYEDFVCEARLLDPLYSFDYVAEEDFGGYLWEEETNTFVYVEGEQMRKRYGEFWADRPNWSVGRKGEEAVPRELGDYLAKYLLKGREAIQEVMASMVSDRELSAEEIRELTKDNIAIKAETGGGAARRSRNGKRMIITGVVIWIMTA